MKRGRRSFFVACPLVLLATCGPSHPALTDYVPAGADAIAYVDLARVRATPLSAKLPVPDSLRDASAVLLVLKGSGWAAAARGNFRRPPAGTTQLAPDVSAAGAPDLVRAMSSRPRGAAGLLSHAPSGAPVWLVARGSAILPVSGNLANLNRLLHQADYTSVAVRLSEPLQLDGTAECRSPEAARHLEENIRALASLAQFQALQVTSSGATVRASATLSLKN